MRLRDIIDNNRNNPREMWKHSKSLLPEKSASTPEKIKIENYTFSDKVSIANKFYEYFVTSVNDIVNGIPQCTRLGEITLLSFPNAKNKFSKFEQLFMLEMTKYFKRFKKC